MDGEERTSRSRFLKQLGTTLAAAVGVGASAAAARAGQQGNCCSNCSSCGSCGANSCYCLCDCTAFGGAKYCWTNGSGCQFTGHCVLCPC